MAREIFRIQINEDDIGKRLDVLIAEALPDISRSRAKMLIEGDDVTLPRSAGQSFSASYRIKEANIGVLSVLLPELVDANPKPEDIKLNIVYEDDDLLVINKQVGLVVHPGAGNHDGTLVNALLFHCGDTLSGIGGVRRPGIVHRLDKDTSGLMVVAKNDAAHQKLSSQLADRTLGRIYKALAWGVPNLRKGMIETSIGRHPVQRQKMAANVKGGKAAKTYYKVTETYSTSLCLVECKLDSGRTHQIRVHMTHKGHPLVGDTVYNFEETKKQALLKRGGYEGDVATAVLSFPRQALHACRIRFVHPSKDEEMSFEAPLPDDFLSLISLLEQHVIN